MNEQDYVKWFRNAAPYINAHRGKTFVLLFSGKAVEHDNFANIIQDVALLNSLGVRLVLVHGARKQIKDYLNAQSLDDLIVNGLRVTNRNTLHCVTAAVGTLKAKIEALLSMGLANSPMHGADIRVCSGNLVIAKPIGVRDGQDYMNTGNVRRVDVKGINDHLNDGSIVLLSPMGYSPTGEVFNLSAADVATATAIALKADKLIAYNQQPGILDTNQQLIAAITLGELESSELNFDFRSAIINTAKAGIKRCHSISYKTNGALLQELFTSNGSGTLIAQNDYERCRQATNNDVSGILDIITPLEQQGILVKRSRELLENEIQHFTVIEQEGMIIACAALYPYLQEQMGEIACVAIHTDFRGEERGEQLIAALIKQAKALQLRKVFVLTTVTAHWFIEQGFVETSLDDLPMNKQLLYNFQRNAKILNLTI